MINGMTFEEYNARERRRGSIVAKLHGYIPLDYGDTEASLTAEYLEITGEPYKTQAEEMAAKVKAAEETLAQRIALRNAADRQSIVAARLAGFMDCSDVFDALGFDRVNAGGETRSVMQVAYRWIRYANFEVEYIIPDGITDVPKAQRTGCYADDLPEIVACKDAYYAELRQREWDTAMLSATDAREKDGDGGNMNWTTYMESLGVRPEVDLAPMMAATGRQYAIEKAERDADRQRDESIIAAMRDYDGPLNRRGKPRMRPLRQHLEAYDVGRITRPERNELWAKAQGE